MGKVFISIMLGLGLATIFRRICKEKNCLRFRGPIIGDIDGKIYQHGEKCYKYETKSADKCDENKKVLDTTGAPKDLGEVGGGLSLFQK